jgi:hypothetical protein
MISLKLFPEIRVLTGGLLKGFPLEKILFFFQDILKNHKYLYYGG